MSSKSTMIRQQTWLAPKAAENDDVHAAITLPASGTTVVTTAITNPDVPRTIRLKANQATVDDLVITLAGTDMLDQVITEDVTMGAFATATDSLKAFKTVTSITVPTRGASGDTVTVGLGAALGLDCYTDEFSFKGLAEVTSFTSDADVLSKNTVLLAGTLNGTANHAIPYIPSVFPKYGRVYG